jgi:hypothetical protein
MILPLATRSFKEKAGWGIQDWLQTAEALIGQLESVGASNGEAMPDFIPRLDNITGSLARAACYYPEAPADAARFSGDPKAFAQTKSDTGDRERVVLSLITVFKRM